MQKAISRRRFLKQATLAGGAALLAGTSGAAKPSAHSHAGQPRPYHPSRAKVAASFGRSADYAEVTRQRVFKMHLEPHGLMPLSLLTARKSSGSRRTA